MPPPEFWMKLLEPNTLLYLAGFITTIIGFIWQNRKLNKNTELTVESKNATERQTKKVESAVKDVQEQATVVKEQVTVASNDAAKKAVLLTNVNAEKVATKAAEAVKEAKIAATTVNDGMAGLSVKFDELAKAVNGKYLNSRAEGKNEGIVETLELKKIIDLNSQRITVLEKGHDELRNGQNEIINRIDIAMNTIIEKIKSS